MQAGLIAQAQRDIQQITSNASEFGTELLLTIGDAEPVLVRGLASNRHLLVEPFDSPVISSKFVYCSISEATMIEAGLITRNVRGEIIMKGWKVNWTDSTGLDKKYLISETSPDNTLGLIVCTLKDLE